MSAALPLRASPALPRGVGGVLEGWGGVVCGGVAHIPGAVLPLPVCYGPEALYQFSIGILIKDADVGTWYSHLPTYGMRPPGNFSPCLPMPT